MILCVIASLYAIWLSILCKHLDKFLAQTSSSCTRQKTTQDIHMSKSVIEKIINGDSIVPYINHISMPENVFLKNIHEWQQLYQYFGTYMPKTVIEKITFKNSIAPNIHHIWIAKKVFLKLTLRNFIVIISTFWNLHVKENTFEIWFSINITANINHISMTKKFSSKTLKN